MVTKKKVSKKTIHKKTIAHKPIHKKVEHHDAKHEQDIKVEKILVENFVGLQSVMTNLSGKFEDLTKQISKLLDLFEIAAKSLSEKDVDVKKRDEEGKEILDRLEGLADQNKTIAKGLTLMHDKLPSSNVEETYVPPQEVMPPKQIPQIPKSNQIAPPQMSMIKKLPPSLEKKSMDMGEYQKSISSE